MQAGKSSIIVAAILVLGLGGCQRVKRLIHGDPPATSASAASSDAAASDAPAVNLEDFANYTDVGAESTNAN